jgi:hypothetical protein
LRSIAGAIPSQTIPLKRQPNGFGADLVFAKALMLQSRHRPKFRTSGALSGVSAARKCATSAIILASYGVILMLAISRLMILTATAAALMTSSADAKSCFKKASEGNALTETLAKFQVDAALLQATDWSIYATWVTGAGTPGYSFGPRTYKCNQGSVLWQCRGSATLCKL